MTSVAETADFPDENSKFTRDFEEYRRACRERYQQQKPQQIAEEEEEYSSDDENGAEDLSGDECEVKKDSVLKDPRYTISAASSATNTCNNTPLPNNNISVLNSSVEVLRSSAGTERRNSFSKVMSFCSSVFKKSGGDSPTLSGSNNTKEKEKLKMERNKAEQDWRMARFIAELEFEGRSDEEIQMHLFHLRDQAQFARPRSNSIGEWFRGMHQAFKDELSARKCVTVHVSTVNPFAAAVPANYVHDLGYSYEDLVSLESVPRGLKSFDHLPTLVYEGQELPSSQTICAICMADFEISEDLRSLHCSHHFHKECIDKWLGVATTCPVCKGEVHSE